MIEKSHYLQIRGTIFINNGISYNSENITKMMTLFPKYVPSLQAIEIPNGLLQGTIEQQPWKMVSPNSEYSIHIVGNKIDILYNIGVLFNEQIITEFADFCSKSFIRMAQAFNSTIIRMALSPKYAIKTMELGGIKTFANEVFRKNNFCATGIDSLSFNNVFRVNKKIGNLPCVRVNFLATFEEGNLVEQIKDNPDTIIPCLCFTFDINTFPVQDITFTDFEVNAFFSDVIIWNKEFADFYKF